MPGIFHFGPYAFVFSLAWLPELEKGGSFRSGLEIVFVDMALAQSFDFSILGLLPLSWAWAWGLSW